MTIAAKEIQSLSFANIYIHLVVTIPDRCLKWKSEYPFLMNIEDYLNHTKEIFRCKFTFGILFSSSSYAKSKIECIVRKIYIPLDNNYRK